MNPIPESREGVWLLDGASPFDLRATLECGQAFRWERDGDGSYAGVVRGAVAQVSQEGDKLRVRVAGRAGVADGRVFGEAFWRSYFSLDVDYAAIHAAYGRNRVLSECLRHAPGLRVLRQEFGETLITFICSQNNNIARIRGIVRRLCEAFGARAGTGPSGEPLHAFPDPAFLAARSEGELAPLRAGYRAPAILDGARRLADGSLDAQALAAEETAVVRERLLGVRGVGPKIADCVLLFGLGRFESFPVDVWIRRAMAGLFPRGLPCCARATAGIAQQYIFHYMRTCRACRETGRGRAGKRAPSKTKESPGQATSRRGE